ncbi:hypothetical protein GCM10007913_11840 [Devosia yakushimensis]|uniref:DUF4376 domain-containing protein n=1 Tax=Devosia yakushimensis TaxID=470028 RepID=A0ABQ5UD23_9HYPH|nr:DUF4376 domain-containing protein [Devosia yakushimensis]GLQ09252.1 hypothetical protein GCM10007913_11840 [Devosia yakushimensis]
MPIVSRQVIAEFGSAEAFANAVSGFAQALENHKLTEDVPAPTAPWIVELIVRNHGGEYEIEPIPPGEEPVEEPAPPTLEELRAIKLAELANWRFIVETAGVEIGGVLVRTDRQTSAIITAAYVKALQNPDYVVANWKVADGVFVTLDAATIFVIAEAVSTHVQRSFDHEAYLTGLLLTASSIEAINAIDLAAGWFPADTPPPMEPPVEEEP